MADVDTGANAWLMVCTCLVMFMTPGLGLFYGGFVSEKAIINTMMMSFGCLAIVSVLWSIVGYSIAFDEGPVIGTGQSAALDLVDDRVRVGTAVPEMTYMLFQMQFAVITPAIISGAVVTKMKYMWFMAFTALWHILVYCPLAHWAWAPSGWLYQYGLLDFAGGTVVETSSGVSALVLAYWLGPSKKHHTLNPHNIPYILLGAAMLWFGWLGFNAGSAVSAGHLASRALVNTHLAAAAGMAAFNVLEVVFGGDEYFRGRPTAVGAASGAVGGLVAITPACGFVLPMWAMFVGAFATFGSYAALYIMKRSGIDDRLDVFAYHGVAGMVGTALTGLFANTHALSPVNGSFYSGGGGPFAKQLAGISTAVLMSAVWTTIIYFLLKGVARLLGTDIKIAEHIVDVDASQHGEKAYWTAIKVAFGAREREVDEESARATPEPSHHEPSGAAAPKLNLREEKRKATFAEPGETGRESPVPTGMWGGNAPAPKRSSPLNPSSVSTSSGAASAPGPVPALNLDQNAQPEAKPVV